MDSDMEYGPNFVARLRDKFNLMAKQSTSSSVVLMSYKRFSSMDDILSSEGSDGHCSKSLPRMKTSKSANDQLSSTTTGYSSEESSSQSSEHQSAPLNHDRFPRDNVDLKYQSQPSLNQFEQVVSRVVVPDEVDENTVPRVPIRSLREKFEGQANQVDYGVKKSLFPRSISAHTVAKYHESPNLMPVQREDVDLKKSTTFPSDRIEVSTFPRISKTVITQRDDLPSSSSTLPKNNRSLVNEVVRFNNVQQQMGSPVPSVASNESFQPDEVIPETSDELESIVSQEENDELSDVNVVCSSPKESFCESEKYYSAHDHFNFALHQKSMDSTASLMFKTPQSTLRRPRALQSNKPDGVVKRVTFTLPLDKPVLRKDVEDVPFFGRPGSTPMHDDPAKLAALKDESGILEVHRLLSKFNAKRLAEQQQEEKEQSSSSSVVTKKYDSPVKNSAEKPPLPHSNHEHLFASSAILGQTTQLNGTATSSSSCNSAPRKSLSARYLESKQQQQTSFNESTENNHPDSIADVNTISENATPSIYCNELGRDDEDNTSVSSMDSLDIVEEVVDCQPHEVTKRPAFAR